VRDFYVRDVLDMIDEMFPKEDMGDDSDEEDD
jgi:hypothetical protein